MVAGAKYQPAGPLASWIGCLGYAVRHLIKYHNETDRLVTRIFAVVSSLLFVGVESVYLPPKLVLWLWIGIAFLPQ
jgi:hypothetical protein